jgi:hypothetical protein
MVPLMVVVVSDGSIVVRRRIQMPGATPSSHHPYWNSLGGPSVVATLRSLVFLHPSLCIKKPLPS